jgi:hypothetical protein
MIEQMNFNNLLLEYDKLLEFDYLINHEIKANNTPIFIRKEI